MCIKLHVLQVVTFRFRRIECLIVYEILNNFSVSLFNEKHLTYSMNESSIIILCTRAAYEKEYPCKIVVLIYFIGMLHEYNELELRSVYIIQYPIQEIANISINSWKS